MPNYNNTSFHSKTSRLNLCLTLALSASFKNGSIYFICSNDTRNDDVWKLKAKMIHPSANIANRVMSNDKIMREYWRIFYRALYFAPSFIYFLPFPSHFLPPFFFFSLFIYFFFSRILVEGTFNLIKFSCTVKPQLKFLHEATSTRK